uniref:AP-5 complex subunit beta-1 n=1 Tax=Salvator merianae TaxID=96440 RepID=A0A8D0E5E2_SALMN
MLFFSLLPRLVALAMGSRSGEGWISAVSSFRLSPTAFLLSHAASDVFLAELLQELRNEKLRDEMKISMLTLLLEYPSLLCPDAKSGQETAVSLLSLFAQQRPGPKRGYLRCHLLFTTGTVLIATGAFGEGCPPAHEYLSLLLQLASDLNDCHGGAGEHPVRAAACEALRELENCYPGLLSQRLAVLRSLQEQEASVAHQGYALLYALALRNAVVRLAGGGPRTLGELLSGSAGLVWEATREPALPSLGPVDQLALLPSPGDLKELKSVVSALLDNSFLLSPVAQGHLLWQLAQAVSVVRTQSPTLFKAQLVRLFGTASVTLQHAALQLKALFTDSLFTAEDECFLLRRLVSMAQHPALPDPVKLFYLDCLLHFPENRPLGSGLDEGLPVLLTPRTTSGLFPSLFQDQDTVLARLNLLGMVCTESEGPVAEQVASYLLEHVLTLGGLVAKGGGPEATRLFFRAAFLFARHFASRPQPMAELTHCLLDLYSQDCALARHVIDLLDKAWGSPEEGGWVAALAGGLQERIVGLPLREEEELGRHLRVLAWLARAKGVPQGSTVRFLKRLVASGRLGDWHLGQLLLSVCRNLMQLRPLPCPPQLADILQAVSLAHRDVDVQDRARFYYTLLANLSGEKLAAVLAPGGPAKARTLSSSIVADSESFAAALTVHPEAPAPLRLQRVGTGGPAPALPPPAHGDVESCCRQLLEPRGAGQRHLTFELVHAAPSAGRHRLLLCVTLRFVCSDPHYEPVVELCVPCLSAQRPSRALTLTLQPRCPYPTRLDVLAIYTTQDGLTRCSQLEPLDVAFPDLFLPLPVPPWPSEKRKPLFDALWHRFRPGGNESGAESRTVWPVPAQSLGALVRGHFARYVVAEYPGSYGIAVALPPCHHVLLRVQGVEEDAARVDIRTDNWKLLPSLNSYLQSLVTAA